MFIKKFIITLCVLLFVVGFSSARYYNFSHYPFDNIKVDFFEKNNYQYMKYEGTTSAKGFKMNLKDIEQILKKDGYFKFFKFSYYWKRSLENVKDKNIDLSYLDETKLDYPIIGFFVGEDMNFVIYKDQLNQKTLDTIGREYSSNEIKVDSYNNWFIFRIKLNKKHTHSFDYKEFYDTLESLNKSMDVVNYQVGQNPYVTHNIEGFTNNVIQLGIFTNGKIKGLILDLSKINAKYIIPNSVIYGENFGKDEIIANDLLSMYDRIYNYYKYMGSLPNSLGNMSPAFIDITAINPYGHQLIYNKKTQFCYEIGFKPFSFDFKEVYKSEINENGYYMYNICIK